jgi:hypothetical protein
MQKIKLNQKKTALLKPSPFVGNFIPNNSQPVGVTNAVKELPRLAVSFEEFEIKSLTDVPALKIVLAHLVETVFPLVLWRGEEYDAVGNWTDEQVAARASELEEAAATARIRKHYRHWCFYYLFCYYNLLDSK